uniref:Uncharacterized protein n=1 Tax=Molossus molossus TaxID=27622 RepID=A0A7J8E2M0_MOLMO|nr:hypothetical protein HJG59_008953 [Molossus molossus]
MAHGHAGTSVHLLFRTLKMIVDGNQWLCLAKEQINILDSDSVRAHEVFLDQSLPLRSSYRQSRKPAAENTVCLRPACETKSPALLLPESVGAMRTNAVPGTPFPGAAASPTGPAAWMSVFVHTHAHTRVFIGKRKIYGIISSTFNTPHSCLVCCMRDTVCALCEPVTHRKDARAAAPWSA